MTIAQIIGYWPSLIGIALIIVCVRWLRPTPNEYRALGIAWFLLIGGLLAYALVGCASLDDQPETETVTNSKGVAIVRHYGVREFPPACPSSFTEGCYTPGHAWYRDLRPHPDTILHEEEGHGNGMMHGHWYSCGESLCAIVTKSGGHYSLGQIIVKSARGESVSGTKATFKPVDMYKLLGVTR